MLSEENKFIKNLNNLSLNKQDDYINKITYGKKYEFTYIDYHKIIFDLQKINDADYVDLIKKIFKLNLKMITEQFEKYFQEIKFNIQFDCPSLNECKIKQLEYTYKYNVYVRLSKDNNYYECGFDLIQELEQISNDKFYDSKIILDYYEYFIQGDPGSNSDNKYSDYLNDCIFELFKISCTMSKDEYLLAEIMFSNFIIKSELTEKEKKIKMEYFRKIIYAIKSDKINLTDLFDELVPRDAKTGDDLSYDKFIKLIEKKCGEIKYINLSEQIVNFKTFEKIILKLDSKYSPKIEFYWDVFSDAKNTLMDALRMIIELVSKFNTTKKYIPVYIDNLILHHLNEFHNSYAIERIYSKKIIDEKPLLNDILDEITKYSETNQNIHNKDLLDSIYSNIETLYEKFFGKLSF